MDYIEVINRTYPNVFVYCVGDSSNYNNIIHQSGDPIPAKEDLDAAWLDIIRNEIWLKIKAERDRRKEGGVLVESKWFHSDDTSRIQHLGLVLFGPNIPANLMWKTMDGTFVLMTQSLANNIFASIATKDQNIFKLAEEKKQQMIASNDPESYDYLTGWPKIYGEI
jgi:hypothetical protein